MLRWILSVMVAVFLPVLRAIAAEEAIVDLAGLEVTTRLAAGETELRFAVGGSLEVAHGQGSELLGPGNYRLARVNANPALVQYRVFGKSFKPDEADDALVYMGAWRDKGYNNELVTLGSRYKAPSGAIIDTRIHWVSFGNLATEAKAEALRKELEGESVWAWVRKERVQDGRGLVALDDARGDRLGQWELPITIQSPSPMLLENINTGFWQEKRVDQSFAGSLLIRTDESGKLEIIERAPVDTYLQGVLPAEMPALWPIEALKAQAVAARSEVIFNAAKTHMLEGYDFCALEHCRAYGGESLRAESTDAAIAATLGEVITYRGEVVPTVFSANCGGWSEDNDAVWSGPAQPSLRAVADFPEDSNPAPKGPVAYGTVKWLREVPNAYCSDDATYFRWERRYSGSELNALVGKQYKIGPVTNIALGERAPGGRLKSVTLEGRDDSVIVRKELPIRLAFGGLPSAMFTVDFERSPEGLRAVIFRGGGRGHGVGLCQQGARGMALQGKSYAEILRHYFTGVTIERVGSR